MPTALATGWLLDRFDPDSARLDLLLAMGLSTFGLVVAVGVTFHLAAPRGRRLASAAPAMLALGVLAAITVVALAL